MLFQVGPYFVVQHFESNGAPEPPHSIGINPLTLRHSGIEIMLSLLVSISRRIPSDTRYFAKLLPTVALCFVMTNLTMAEETTDSMLASQSRSILKKHCHRCHHGDGSVAGEFDVLKFSSLLEPTKKKKTLLAPQGLTNSYLLERIEKDEMPNDSDPVPAEEKAILRKWVASGLPRYPEASRRKFISVLNQLQAIRDHLNQATVEDRKFLRYFSLAHLYNDQHIPDEDLQHYRGALSKVVNSLSWHTKIVMPRPINDSETIFAIDLRDYDWDRGELWTQLLKAYPYGLKYGTQPDETLQKLDDELVQLTGCDLAYIHGDWFTVTASRPPLYHTMLQLPTNEKELEKLLHVDATADIVRDRAVRAGFAKSGVSRQNRLLERHDAAYGAYWKSFDFKPNNRKANLIAYPLGPVYEGNEHPNQAFEHDGGEMIFHLPNGLQGYYLVDAKGQRIDEGPVDVVNDKAEISGNPTIVNGLSCMVCHKDGMLANFTDTIREGTSVSGAALRKVQRLHVPAEKIQALLKEDQQKFTTALNAAAGKYLKDNYAAEPVGEISQLYRLRELDLNRVSCELGFEKPEHLLALIDGNKKLRELGLAPLLKLNGVIKRNDWESIGGTSLYQRVARELNRGTPFRVLQ